MKANNLILGLFVAFAAIFIISCEDNNVEPDGSDYGILPEKFKVDIPNSISNPGSGLKSTQDDDTLSGDEIYEHLTNFIAIGEGAADIVEAIIIGIRVHKIDQVKMVTYVSEDDNREKKLIVNSGVEYDGRTWEYQLTITDVLLENETDGGVGMQVFWNNEIIEGIALIKPSNLDVKNDSEMAGAMFSIEYSERKMGDYEAHMIVGIAEMPLSSADPFSVNTLKMFVGKKGNIVDVYGNSNHPNAKFNTLGENAGFNWAFVASGHETKDIGVAEVGLPSNTADISTRKEILEDYSIKSVLTSEISDYIIAEYAEKGITLKPEEVERYIAPYLKNAEAPGFFDKNGFVQSETSPGDDYTELSSSIKALTPYNPKSIAALKIEFK